MHTPAFHTVRRMICRWEALDDDFIHAHADDLDFRALGMNTSLSWTPDLLLRFVDRWVPHTVMTNASVPWDDALIAAYGRRADSYYLQQNPRLNPEAKPIQIPAPQTLGDLTFEPIPGVDATGPIERLDADLLNAMAPKMVWLRLAEAELTWTPERVDLLLPYADNLWSTPLAERLYQQRLRPADPSGWLAERFADCGFLRIDGVRHDVYGLVPGLDIPVTRVRAAMKREAGPIPAEVGRYKAGPNRFHDLVRAQLFKPGLVVHRRLRPLLEAHALPPHFWAELEVDHPSWKDEHLFLALLQSFPSDASVELDHAQDLVGLVQAYDRTYPNPNPAGGLLASRRLVAALREAGATGLEVGTAVEVPVGMPALAPVESYAVEPVVEADPRSETYRYFEAKQARLEATPATLSRPPTGPLAAAEKRLQRTFAPAFVAWFEDRQGRALGDGFRCHRASRLEILDDPVLFKNHPEAYGAVVVASDGCGDSLILLLGKRSDTRLIQRLHRVHHESGTVTRWS